jgi:aminoglycoside phosphotransferase (APT) family kinase protein
LELEALGIPSEAEYLDHYHRSAPECGRTRPFHYAFALFRLAVIFEGISARAEAGTAASADASRVGDFGPVFARRAMELLRL